MLKLTHAQCLAIDRYMNSIPCQTRQKIWAAADKHAWTRTHANATVDVYNSFGGDAVVVGYQPASGYIAWVCLTSTHHRPWKFTNCAKRKELALALLAAIDPEARQQLAAAHWGAHCTHLPRGGPKEKDD